MTLSAQIYPDLAQKVVVVTGGASGIGFAMVEAFVRNGAHVMIIDIDEGAMATARQTLEQTEPEASIETFLASVMEEDAIVAAFSRCVERFGRIDILLNNAGISINQPSLKLPVDSWRRGIDINLTGVFICAQAAGQHMTAQKGGVIINMASMYGVVAAPHRAAYCASKAGVVALTKTLAVEWAPLGIRVNAIGPGYILTPLVEELGQKGRLDLDALRQHTPQGRLGTPEEVARLALFLASENAAFVTGHTLVADGGWSANGYL